MFVVLFVMAVVLCVCGAFFFGYSLLYRITIPIMQVNISGALPGVIVLYLGVRYLIRLSRLKNEVFPAGLLGRKKKE